MSSLLEYPEGLIVDLCVNLGNARGDGARQGLLVMGSQGTMYVGGRGGSIEIYPEPPDNNVQRYGINGWPKRLREQYFESVGYSPDGRPKTPPPPLKDKEVIQVARDENRPTHLGYFIKSVKDRTPTVEDEVAGHNAAAAAHMANQAYREGRKVEAKEGPTG